MRRRVIKESYWHHEMHGRISLMASLLGAMVITQTKGRRRRRELQRMNVHPRLLSHAKFLTYKRTLGDAGALEFLLRIWGHCQEKKRGENWGPVTPDYVEAIAGWTGPSGQLWTALTMPFCGKSGWITLKRKCVTITGWNEHNAGIINSWNAGPKGGRPPETHGKPTANPRVIRGKPTDNPTGLDVTGLDVMEPDARAQASVPVLPQFQEPELQEVRTLASMRGIPEDCALKWFWERKGAGWIRNGAPIVDWQANLQSYAVSWRVVDYLKKPGGYAAGPQEAGLQQLEAELQAETDPEKRRAIRKKIQEAGK